jgi:tRNA(Arg) A34 adenosine deaminase TadA
MTDSRKSTEEALLKLASDNAKNGNLPFSCIIVNSNNEAEILAVGTDRTSTHDTTQTAVMVALDRACKKLGGFKNLKEYTVHLLTYPDPLSLACLYHSTPGKVTFMLKPEEYAKFYQTNQYYGTLDDHFKQIWTPWQERTMPMEFLGNKEGVDGFRMFHEKQTGKPITESPKIERGQLSGDAKFVQRTIELSKENVKNGGNPFSCVVVKHFPDGHDEIIAEAVNATSMSNVFGCNVCCCPQKSCLLYHT